MCIRDRDYSDVTSDSGIWARLKRAETNKTWIDIERLSNNQESISSVAKENQLITSKAITELFVYVEEVKTEHETLFKELNRNLDGVRMEAKRGVLKNSEGKYLQQDDKVTELVLTRRIENECKDKLVRLQQQINELAIEVNEVKRKSEVSAQRLELASAVADDTAKKTTEMLDMIKVENQLVEDTKEIFLTRLSRAENDILSLANKYVGDGMQTVGSNTEGVHSLRIDSLRNQIESDILPKVDQIHTRICLLYTSDAADE
eukprot:TRINITY_DN18060_c0_g1_i1.p1 TRINITY_DN18060_c0_g1~~TRINITY_DN18060_c0_g1_i1.p1  ORF type:complete len:261 (+),score=64.85 TRINITY_DN18060_c0_g1_i1:75-857(+)